MTYTKAELEDILSTLFVPIENGEGGEAFRSDYMQVGNEGYPIYSVVSDCMRDSGLSFDMSYIIGSKAVDILLDVDWNDEDEIAGSVDSAVPVYTSEVMEIYKSDAWAVDEAVAERGNANNSEQNAKYGWYNQIAKMVGAIKEKLEPLCA